MILHASFQMMVISSAKSLHEQDCELYVYSLSIHNCENPSRHGALFRLRGENLSQI